MKGKGIKGDRRRRDRRKGNNKSKILLPNVSVSLVFLSSVSFLLSPFFCLLSSCLLSPS
jgi:hypothetical protein